MTDYSWIVPGAKAIIFKGVNYPQLVGRIVTISSPPEIVTDIRNKTRLGVEIEEGRELARLVGSDALRIAPSAENLKPFKDQEPPNWAEMAGVSNLIDEEVLA